MSEVTPQDINDALERAQTLKDISEKFIDIADDSNNGARIKLEEERDIEIDSSRCVPLDDIPLGEEAIRVKNDMPLLESAIKTLQKLVEDKIPATDKIEKFEEAIKDQETIKETLQDVGAEEVIKKWDDGEYSEEQDN